MRTTGLLLVFSLAAGAQIRLGIVGTDTSHVTAFSKILNDPSSADHVPGARIVAAWKGGSPTLSTLLALVSSPVVVIPEIDSYLLPGFQSLPAFGEKKPHGIRVLKSLQEMPRAWLWTLLIIPASVRQWRSKFCDSLARFLRNRSKLWLRSDPSSLLRIIAVLLQVNHGQYLNFSLDKVHSYTGKQVDT